VISHIETLGTYKLARLCTDEHNAATEPAAVSAALQSSDMESETVIGFAARSCRSTYPRFMLPPNSQVDGALRTTRRDPQLHDTALTWYKLVDSLHGRCDKLHAVRAVLTERYQHAYGE
jgi:hypothetical protein